MPVPSGPTVADPVVQQSSPATQAPSTAGSFRGVGANGSAPSDSNGAIGPNYYFDLVNSQFEIFAKNGTSVLGPETTNTIWSGFGGECQGEDDGDGTVRYDALADRWIVSQFALGPSGNGPFFQCVAVSATADPTGSYYRYSFGFSSFPDYPKLAVWPDGYYQTMNMFNSAGTFLGANTCAYDRSRMLNGQAAGVQCFNTTPTYGAILPGDLDGTTPPPAGAPDMQIGLGRDNTHLASFAFHVDWSPGNAGTSLTESDVAVASYTGACAGGGVCVPQLGTTQLLDSLADRMMYRYAYRNFGDHESWVVTYSVDVGAVAAPRWFELRRTPPATTGALTVYQDSTFAPDGNYRWMGSMAMDQSGDMALGYSESSASMKPAIAYTGRQASDPLNTMEPETVMLAGAGAQTGGLNRWGDYSAMTVDPSVGCTFWYTNQYIPANGSFNWATQIGSFSFPSCTPRTDNDFSEALLPVSGTATAQGSTATSVSVSRTAGSAQSVTLSASGLPPGITASFSPASVTAGTGPPSSSTLTLTAASGTAPGSYTINVNATGTSTSHVATYTLTVPGSSLVNGGFETGSLAGWTNTAGTAAVVAAAAHSGSYGAQLGAATPTNGDSSISQGFTLSQPSTVSLWYAMSCPDTVAFDWATVTLLDNTTGGTLTLLPKTCTQTGAWVQVSAALGASSVGHSFTLTLTSHDDNYPGDPTYTYYDDVALTPTPNPDFALSASPPSQTVVAGSGTSYTVAVVPSNGFNGNVSLSVSGLPSATGAAFNPTSVVGSGSSTLSINTATNTPPGNYALTVTGTSGALTHTATVAISVNALPDFTLSASPASQTVVAGSATSYTATVTSSNGFNGNVGLSVSNLPTGVAATLSPTSVTGSGTSTLSITTAANTAPGTYTLTVTGTSGTLTHTTTVGISVNPKPDFTLSASPSSRSIRRGAATTYTETITPIAGFTGSVKLSMTSSPAGPTGTFNPSTLTSGSSVLTVSGPNAGTFTLTITGVGGGITHSTTVTLTVTKR
jgi:hypothetical protein